jgi:radical SAM protein with 4Fe4S-binding SPASM domain
MNWIIEKLLKFTGSQKFLSIQMDITNSCNLKCIHCYQPNQHGAELPFASWQNILDQYSELTEKLALKPCLSLSGGEPTLSPLFAPMLNEIRHRWPAAVITIITNGTALSEKIISVIKSHGADVQLSLDGPDAERHDVIRGKGSFDKMMVGCSALQNAGINPTFQAVLSRRTAPWISDFFGITEKLKISTMNFTRFVPQGRGKILAENQEDRPLLGLELRSAYAKILESSRKTGIATGTNSPLFVLLAPELGAHGKAGFQGVVVDYRGNLKLTSRADFKLGNILEEGLGNLFLNHPIMKDLRARRVEVCGICEYYDRCGGDRNASFVEYGSFLKKDPGCWLQPGMH